jgi:hypothetical protein
LSSFGEFDFDDPRSLEFALDAFPAQKDGMQMVPIPPKAVPAWAVHLKELGFRHHVDLMEKFPMPGEQPGMGWMNPNRYVSREEYEAEKAKPAATPMDEAMNLLASINPAMAEHIASMSEDDRKSAVAEQEDKIPEILASLAKARELMERSTPDGSSS